MALTIEVQSSSQQVVRRPNGRSKSETSLASCFTAYLLPQGLARGVGQGLWEGHLRAVSDGAAALGRGAEPPDRVVSTFWLPEALRVVFPLKDQRESPGAVPG